MAATDVGSTIRKAILGPARMGFGSAGVFRSALQPFGPG
jgi:hypothetical protein